MRIFDQPGDEDEGPPAAREASETPTHEPFGQGTVWVSTGPLAPARTRAVWILTLVDLALAGACGGIYYFLGQAQAYLLGDSPEFGADLDAATLGLRIMRIACLVLATGFVLSALGTISASRFGWRIQRLWAALMCLTVAGLPYGIGALIVLRRAQRAEAP